MIDTMIQTTGYRAASPCAPSTSAKLGGGFVRLTGDVTLAVRPRMSAHVDIAVQGAFPGSHTWSPPI
jgi:hypothetical protein